MEELTIGSRVVLLREMLGEHGGSVGYVYNLYQDFDNPDKQGVEVIFSGGGHDGFSVNEQRLYLDFIDHDPRYSMYEFKNVIQLSKDFRNGYWKFYE